MSRVWSDSLLTDADRGEIADRERERVLAALEGSGLEVVSEVRVTRDRSRRELLARLELRGSLGREVLVTYVGPTTRVSRLTHALGSDPSTDREAVVASVVAGPPPAGVASNATLSRLLAHHDSGSDEAACATLRDYLDARDLRYPLERESPEHVARTTLLTVEGGPGAAVTAARLDATVAVLDALVAGAPVEWALGRGRES